jgi:uncharacterized protein (TIGR02284 family)
MVNAAASDHEVDVINGLIETTRDSVDGYRAAAEQGTHAFFRASLLDRAREREFVVRRLSERVRELGGEPEDDGSILADAHRAFLSLRDRVDPDAIVAEIDHGESYLAGKWQAALDNDELTPATRQLLHGCYEAVRRGQQEWRRTAS